MLQARVQLVCVHTNRVESSRVHSSPVRLYSHGVAPRPSRVQTNLREFKWVLCSLNCEQLNKSKAMEDIIMLVLYTIMCRRSWRCKWRSMWVHQINIKRPEFGIFSHLYRIWWRMKRNLMTFLERTSSNSTVCHNAWERKYETRHKLEDGDFN